jgi:uroporphyrin-III C-methyltransferase
MGLGRIAALADRLLARGWAPGTPAALVVDASMPRQQTWRGTLDDLAQGRCGDIVDRPGPGTIVVGEVVSVEALCQPLIKSPHTAARG